MELLLLESLLSALDTLVRIIRETSFLLRSGLVAETDLEYSTENFVAEQQYCLKISLKSSTATIEKVLMSKLESSSDFAQIRKTFIKTGGIMSSISSGLE